MRFSSLRSRIVLLLLAVVLPVYFILFYSAHEQRQTALKALKQEVTTDVRILSGLMGQKVEGARALLFALSHTPAIQNRNSALCDKLLADILSHNPQYTNLGATDPKGNVFCSALPRVGPVNASDKAWFQRTIKSNDIAFGDYQIGRIVNKPVVIMGYAARDKSGRSWAAVFVPFDLAGLSRMPEQVKLPGSTEFLILDHNGTILSRTPDHEKWVGKTITESALIQTILTQYEGLIETKGIDGIKRIYSFTPVTGTDNNIFISLGILDDIALAGINRQFTRNLIIFSLLAVLSFAAALIISRLAKHSEDKLQKSEGQLRTMLENAGDAIVGIRPPGVIFIWNNKAEEIYGYSRTEAIGRNYHEIIVPERFRREALNGLERFFQTGEGPVIGKTLAHTGLRRDGTEFPVELTVAALKASGEWQSIGIVRDITERKKVENLISARLQLSQFAMSHSLDEILQATLDEVEKLTNSQIGFYHFLEPDQRTLSLQMWSTGTLRDMCKAEGKGLHYDIDQAGVWADCVRERRPVIHNDYSALQHKKGMPSGHAEVVRVLVVPVFRGDRIVAILGVGNKLNDYDGSDVRTVSVFADLAWDIAEAKQTQDRSVALAGIVEDSLNEIYIFDAATLRFIEVNKGARTNLGYTLEELRELTPLDLKPEFTPDSFAQLIAPLKSGQQKLLQFTTVHRRKDCSEYPVEVYLQLLSYGETAVFVAIILDVTERKKAEEELNKYREHLEELVKDRTVELAKANVRLQELDRLKSLFIASMSHELRTPLNSIIGFSSMLLQGWRGQLEDVQKEDIEIMHKAGKHLLALINDVIDVSKVEAGTIEIQPEEFDLEDVINEAVKLVRKDIETKGLALEVNSIHCHMQTDRRRLLQCILNILNNAVKFTERGSVRVAVRLTKDEGRETKDEEDVHHLSERSDRSSIVPRAFPSSIEISVYDTGIGIREEDIPKLFKSFIRLDSPLRSIVPGTGLGLYLTKKLVTEALKGDIMVESEYGKGSRFIIIIPVKI